MNWGFFSKALALTAFAGLSTGIGGALVLLKKEIDSRFMSFALGFSGGVMIYVSLTEIFSESKNLLCAYYGSVMGSLYNAAAFFGGIFLVFAIDRLTSDSNKRLDISACSNICSIEKHRLLRSGIMTAFAIAVHNFPEGIATFSMSITDLSLGIPIASAIAIHNIPEGIAVAAPIYKATGKRRRAFFTALCSGLAEPLGGIIGYLILMPFINDALLGVILGSVSGVMVFISLDELLPLSHEYGDKHIPTLGNIAGMAVMALSLLLFG